MSDEVRRNVVLVLGTIGSGKTTLCRELGAHIDALVLTEAAQEQGNNLITLFYQDMHRHAFHLQVSQLARRFRQHALAQWWALNDKGDVVVDGGFWMDVCFMKMLRTSGIMTEMEGDTYQMLFHAMTSVVLHPTFVIRINTSPDVAIERIQERALAHPERAEEAERVSKEYLTALDEQITGLVQEFVSMGIHVENVFWDERRGDGAQREHAVDGLTRLIRQHVPPDPFTGPWRRRVG